MLEDNDDAKKMMIEGRSTNSRRRQNTRFDSVGCMSLDLVISARCVEASEHNEMDIRVARASRLFFLAPIIASLLSFVCFIFLMFNLSFFLDFAPLETMT